ncbi:DUF444 family protein [Haladaptatus sp. F3-133]|uniref:DUF444 family protein n=1 Tax=Halorutilus salinus TaxID=2487751 RepID=A0A9Q4C5M0_9EURY|nr:DUF444 family protein [Halorutilus salinus]MCX2819512.1 DUF444 family protein [Halorutilus salinus]
MGLRDDLDRYRKVGEERRDDLAEFIQYGDLGQSRRDEIRIPIKIVELPEFEYDRRDLGGVGQGDADEGDAVGRPQQGDGDEDGEPGEGEGEHGYYEMDPEEFAEELEQEFELQLEPKGKAVVEEKEGDMTDVVRSGPRSTLDLERMFKRGLRRKLASQFDPEYVREALRVDGMDPEDVYGWARRDSINVSKRWLEETYAEMDAEEWARWSSLEEMEENVDRRTPAQLVRADSRVPFRSEDERYRFPEVVEEHESKVVVVNIRDVSGSMGSEKRELVERTFTPLDWYLQGKYEEAEFVYIAHDIDAWEVDRGEFFGIQSGGGTKISSAYELAAEILEERYPWSDWNRYVFTAGDGENSSNDSKERVVPLIEGMDANLHAYVETQPSGGSVNATHSQELTDAFDGDEVVVTQVNARDEVMDAVYTVLKTAAEPTEEV